MAFQCNKCGECCRQLRRSSLYKELDRGDGICKYLSGNLCGIYKNRPLLCRVDESYDAFFKDVMSLDMYYRLNYTSCKQLQGQVKDRNQEMITNGKCC